MKTEKQLQRKKNTFSRRPSRQGLPVYRGAAENVRWSGRGNALQDNAKASFVVRPAGTPTLGFSENMVDRTGQLMMGYRGAKVLMAAVELDLFCAIERTGGSLEAVAAEAGVAVPKVKILLNALAALGFIDKSHGRFHNTEFSLDWFHPAGAHSMISNLRYQELLSKAYTGYVETVRTGRPSRNLRDLLSQNPGFVDSYICGMADIARRPARELASALDVTGACDFLDIGGGPGIFTLAFLERFSEMKAVLLDLPETLVCTRSFVSASPCASRVELWEGDYHTKELGEERFDVVLISNVTHDENAEDNARMICKAYRALRPGGRIVIHDFMTYADGTLPLFSVLFSVHLSTYTAQGQTYDESDYSCWLKDAGFTRPRFVPICPGVPNETAAVIAEKL